MNETAIQVQTTAKQVMALVQEQISVGMTERDVATLAEREFHKLGINSFWYYGIAAFVLVGERTPLSISGREYEPAETEILDGDLVTIDLSPELNGEWGDYARSIVVTKNGAFLDEFPSGGPMTAGLDVERQLHQELVQNVRTETTFHDVFEMMNRRISDLGYVNLDFRGNLGHSIEYSREQRIYIEKGNSTRLADVNRFTFEPHIRRSGELHGFKRENIYYFSDGSLTEV